MSTAAPERFALPGVVLPGGARGRRPDRLLAPGTLLLAGVSPGSRRTWNEHLMHYGPVPRLGLEALAEAAESVDLRGYGGAGFPTAVKLRAARHRLPALVVVNATEGEQASAKDGVLLRHVPHLVLDGAMAAAQALGASTVTVRVSDDRPDLPAVLGEAVAERGATSHVRVSVGEHTFAAGESSAVVNAVTGRPALPSPLGRPAFTPSTLSRRRRPALVCNAETFARLGLAARGIGSSSALVTVSGAVPQAGVRELASTATLGEALGWSDDAPLAGVVTGGWHGRWVPWTAPVRAAALTRAGLETVSGRWGAGVMVALPGGVCRLQVVAAVARTLAAGSAGQCGPCRMGLPFIASELTAVAAASNVAGPALVEAEDAMASLRGRGICSHPTAAVDALRSALQWASDDLQAHRQGRCLDP